MAQNPFTRTNDSTQKPNRNVFDGSFVNHLTLKAGQITPVFCKEVLPGDSFKIDASFGFNFQPMLFPVQSKMKANLHFFYLPNRTLWRGWENFITKTENRDGDSIPPYIALTNESRKMFETGQIGDYLGIPTVVYGGKNEESIIKLKPFGNSAMSQYYLEDTEYNDVLQLAQYVDNPNATSQGFANIYMQLGFGRDQIKIIQAGTSTQGKRLIPVSVAILPPNTKTVDRSMSSSYLSLSGVVDMSSTRSVVSLIVNYDSGEVYSAFISAGQNSQSVGFYSRNDVGVTYDNVDGKPLFVIDPLKSAFGEKLALVVFATQYYEGSTYPSVTTSVNRNIVRDLSMGISLDRYELSELPFATVSDGDNAKYKLRVSAMPFRAVEACYNAFYRDERNNPLMIDGTPYYNTWVKDKTGGADFNLYELYNANWEQDFLTTSVQSPQQGVLPLVGVTATGNMTFSDENGKTYYLQAELADDGQLLGISSYSSDMPVGTLRAMVDTISTGISINDFRNVNAFQRWLETNMRKGLRYKDQIEAHFGTSPTYSELQMPQFIGGMSRTVNISAVEQTVDTVPQGGYPLGTLGGRATVMGEAGAPISHYCEEHGWIIGFLSIVPTPVYSQQLNKQLLKTELLDYYFPEFAHIGYQPILNREVAPLQCKLGQTEDSDGLNDVFGYQRAWYEYLSYVDEVHGDFRDSMRNYLIQRLFNGVPKLNKDFLTVGDKEVNEVFAVTDTEEDKIFGIIAFDVKMKRPLPALGIPKLEV